MAIGRDPVSVDLDGAGLGNAEEIRVGAGVLNPDSDGDGVADGQDAFPLDPSRSEAPPPDPGDTTAPILLLREPRNAVLMSVKFNGSPTELANKLFLDRLQHARLTTWWNRLMRELQSRTPPPPPKR